MEVWWTLKCLGWGDKHGPYQHGVTKSRISEPDRNECEFQLCHLLSIYSWASVLLHGFLICKARITEPTSFR